MLGMFHKVVELLHHSHEKVTVNVMDNGYFRASEQKHDWLLCIVRDIVVQYAEDVRKKLGQYCIVIAGT